MAIAREIDELLELSEIDELEQRLESQRRARALRTWACNPARRQLLARWGGC